jgi:hypothetical protein
MKLSYIKHFLGNGLPLYRRKVFREPIPALPRAEWYRLQTKNRGCPAAGCGTKSSHVVQSPATLLANRGYGVFRNTQANLLRLLITSSET